MLAFTKKLTYCIAIVGCVYANAIERTSDAELSPPELAPQKQSNQTAIGNQEIPSEVLTRFNSLEKPPKVLKLVTPMRPGQDAYGSVLVIVHTNALGDVISVEPLFGKAALHQAVVKSLMSSKFVPTGQSQTFGYRSVFMP